MVFLLKLIVLTSLVAFHIAEGNIALTATHERINALSTKNFIMNCTYGAKNRQIVSLVLSKVIEKGAVASRSLSKKLVSMKEDSRIIFHSPSPDVKYTGGMQGKGKAYLSGQWNRVPEGFGGIYQCKINVIDGVGRIYVLNRQVQIVEEKPTFEHSVAAIKELQTSYQKLQTWKESMVLGFDFLDRAAMKTSYSGVYRNKYYIAYHHPPHRVKYAEDFCRSRGGYLAELNDFNEWKFVVSFLKSSDRGTAYWYYISGRLNRVSNKFYWPRMGKWSPAYFNWTPDRDPSSSECVGIVYYRDWRAISTKCSYISVTGMICEMPKIK